MKRKKASDKWLAICEQRDKDKGIINCPLCKKYYTDPGVIELQSCRNCPVRKFTGKHECEGTPYYAWRNYVRFNAPSNKKTEVFDKKSFELALDMYSFLLAIDQ